MAWNPDKEIPDGPLTKVERQDTRRVLHWYERREWLRTNLVSWVKWLVGLPFAMLSLWQLIQLIAAHVK